VLNFPFLSQQIFNRPLAIRPEKAEIIMGALADRLGIVRLRLPDGRIRAFDGGDVIFDSDGPVGQGAGYEAVAGVAVIEVHGTLVQRQLGLRPVSGMTGYNAIRTNIFTALDDPGVKAIALDIDSGGGDCAGLFDLTDAIFAARSVKPIWAILDESAGSAAYAIAAATSRITMPRTGYAGSIGVIALHVDVTKMLEKEGVTVTVVQYGARKADGQPMVPLSAAARKQMQADVDTLGELFVGSVARYRRLPATKIRDQQAAVFLGARALEAGLVDAILSPAAAFAALVRSLN
jgi:signal peptide peptidase SppA